MIHISFPDGRVEEFPKGVTGLEIAQKISQRLAKEALGIVVNGETRDLTRPINTDALVKLLMWDDDEGKKVMWHSSAHLMAEALEQLYPGVKFGIGPPVANGYYYDIDLGGKEITAAELVFIEKLMLEMARKDEKFIRREVPKAEAIEYFTKKGDEYKLELLQDLNDGEITFYTQGNFTDLCRGPHLPDTSYIKAIKLTNIAGAYWRGDEKNKQLTRIYGITFPKAKLLEEYLVLLEEAKKRDHRKLGKELELFTFSDKVGGGLPLWLPNGTIVRDQLEQFLKKEQKIRKYLPVMTPHIGKKDLYVTSGHYEKYGKDSFQPITTPDSKEEYLLKPMNCPHHCEIYKSKQYSYKDLPIRLAEFGTVYRYEQSGELNGLTRVRGFTVDDSHIFCRADQVKEEFLNVIDLVTLVFSKLGFSEFTAQISLRDPENKTKYIGTDENWAKAESAIVEAAQEKGLKTITELGEAAFYGPKLDFMVKDVLGRSWQLGTIQVDYNLPERFELEYIGADNQKHRPVMIHRAPFGSMERFMGILIEQCAGEFPLWLAPEQVKVIPVAEKYINYAETVCNILNNSEIRTSIDDRNEKIGKKIRDAEIKKVPYMIIVGEKEETEGKISVRKHKEGDLGTFETAVFIEQLKKEIESI
jgi:threonyl-tRNA synthetase